MTLQEKITEETTEENNQPIPEVLPEKRPEKVKTAAEIEKTKKETLVPSGAVNPEIIGKKPLKEAMAKDIVKQEEQRKVPSINDFLSGNTFMLGDQEIDSDLIQKAKEGDQDAIVELGSQIDTYASTQTGPIIPSVRKTETGALKTVKVTEDKEIQQELTKYGEARVALYNRMKGVGVQDENALNALVKYYSTGNFITEFSRRVTQA